MTGVAIIGVGQTVHADARPDVDIAELVLEAVQEALDDAGVGLGDIENSVTAVMDFWDGRTIANMSVAEVVGSYRKSEARTCADAIQAMLYMWSRIATDSFRIGLVTTHCKESAGNVAGIENAALDPFNQRRLGFDGSTVEGLIVRTLIESKALTPEQAAEVVVEARRRGSAHPKLDPLAQVSVDDVLGSEMIADPIRALDRAPNRDGAAAFVFVAEDLVSDLGADPVWVKGASTVTGPYWSDAELGDTSTLDESIKRATAQAGWGSDSPDLVEMSAQFSYQHLRFAPRFGLDPLAPNLNTSGGWMAGNPFVVSGASRVAECVHQIRGDAGGRQLDGVERALAHGIHGLAAQTHSVLALEGSS